MRDYGKVHTSFWSSATVSSMSEDGRMLALYLLTSPHSNITGVFRLPDGYAMEDLNWTPERVSKGFAELFRKGFANRCETTKWVWISKHLEWNQPENPNQRKAAKKIAVSIPDECGWKLGFMRVWGESLDISQEEWGNPCETVPEPFLNQEQEQEQKQEKEQEKNNSRTTPKPKSGSGINADDLQARGVDPQVATDFLALRAKKRAPVTATALAGLEREAAAAGMTLNDALRTASERGWQGFKAEWVRNEGAPGRPLGSTPLNEADRRKQEFLRLAGHGGQDNRTFDMEQA
ncbi:hypothetical protein ACOTCJ_11695 [Achromobacter xylosoxidans]|uniref:hypothetical protein n=1 Tax=Alcaligenes xylosoxydans xylosoxydans TaxID=85698 RepID=UPI001F3259A2|nr:hypothetical protein [Achromobacter xylosoxidans]